MKGIRCINIAGIALFLFCSNTYSQWVPVHPTNPTGRSRGIAFVLGDTAYLGCGQSPIHTYHNDFISYTPATNTWTNSPGGTFTIQPYLTAGDIPFTFVIGDNAYVGTSATGGQGLAEYVATTGAWLTKANFPGTARGFGVGFCIGDTGYAGTGAVDGAGVGGPGGGPFSDFYAYHPTGDTWAPKTAIPVARFGGVGFSAGGKGYVGLGANTNTILNDMYMYDPTVDKWTVMASMPVQGMQEPAYFVLCGKLIVTLGSTLPPNNPAISETNQVWMFDPSDGAMGTWTRLPDFPGSLAFSASGFAIAGSGYVVGGDSDATNPTANVAITQMWKYTPTLSSLSAVLGNVTICSGSSTILSANGSSIYTWSPSVGLSATLTAGSSTPGEITQTVANPLSTITYTVTEAICGQQYAFVTVNVLAAPTLFVSANATICSGNSTKLSATGGTNYNWTPSAGLSSPAISNPTASPTATTTYTVITDNGTCSSSNSNITVTVNPVPAIYAGANASITIGQTYTITATANSNGLSYSWTPEVVSSNGSMALVRPLSTTKYYVTATDPDGCAAADSVIIYVNSNCNDIFIPNAFSPNGDNINDLFSLQTQNSNCIIFMTFQVYDRWGNQVFESTDPNNGWNGKYKGKELDEAVFVYSLQATLINGSSISKKGNISLIK